MEELNFKPKKTKEEFLNNYVLHDIAKKIGEQELKNRGFDLCDYGEDRRGEKVWEAGKDKPDAIIKYLGKELCLIDWKGKNKGDSMGIINVRAFYSYCKISEEKKLPVYLCVYIGIKQELKFVQLFREMDKIEKKTNHDKNQVYDLEHNYFIGIDSFEKILKENDKKNKNK